MNVADAITRRFDLRGCVVEVSGQMRGLFNYYIKPHHDLAWVVQDRHATGGFDEAILIIKPGLIKSLCESGSVWIGPYPINEPIILKGCLVDSPDERFPVAITNVESIAFERAETRTRLAGQKILVKP